MQMVFPIRLTALISRETHMVTRALFMARNTAAQELYTASPVKEMAVMIR